eukprot:1138893-Pelagomonas_calceolata.AAC.1
MMLSLEIASPGAHTLVTFQKHPFWGPQMTTSGFLAAYGRRAPEFVESMLSKLSKLHGMTSSLLPVIFAMPKIILGMMMCRMNRMPYPCNLYYATTPFLFHQDTAKQPFPSFPLQHGALGICWEVPEKPPSQLARRKAFPYIRICPVPSVLPLPLDRSAGVLGCRPTPL